jgi:hypothetical protein
MTTTSHHSRRSGITIFDPPAEAPLLHETDIMAMPVMDPPAPDQMTAWARSGGHVVKTLFRQSGDDGMSLVWSWFAPGYPLPRHSHNADCLYFVVSGEARMGNRRIPAAPGSSYPRAGPMPTPPDPRESRSSSSGAPATSTCRSPRASTGGIGSPRSCGTTRRRGRTRPPVRSAPGTARPEPVRPTRRLTSTDVRGFGSPGLPTRRPDRCRPTRRRSAPRGRGARGRPASPRRPQ